MTPKRRNNPNTNIAQNSLNQLNSGSSGTAAVLSNLTLTNQDRQRAVISGPALSSLTSEEKEIVGGIVNALHTINIDGLPEEPRGDTIRSLLWALEELLTPRIEPMEQHPVWFNVSLTQEEVVVGRAAEQEIWSICCGLLSGLQYLTTRGRINLNQVEIPATWSPGDLSCAIQETRPRLERLTTLTDTLYCLRQGEPTYKSTGKTLSVKAKDQDQTGPGTEGPTSNK
jgi:hypothetical protein